MRTLTVAVAAVLWLAAPAAAADAPSDPATPLIAQAAALVHAGKAADAIAPLDQAIALETAAHGQDTRLVFCARSPAEAILYAGEGVAAKRDAVVLGPDWASALFLKGFALVDTGHGDEARPLFERAVALSPSNAQFLAELAEWHKSRREWDQAYALFARAADAAAFTPEQARSFEQRRAWRGMGFVRTEQKRYGEAEAMYRKCLDLDPTDGIARGELAYIARTRAGAP